MTQFRTVCYYRKKHVTHFPHRRSPELDADFLRVFSIEDEYTTSGILSEIASGRLYTKEQVVQHAIAYGVKLHYNRFAVQADEQG